MDQNNSSRENKNMAFHGREIVDVINLMKEVVEGKSISTLDAEEIIASLEGKSFFDVLDQLVDIEKELGLSAQEQEEAKKQTHEVESEDTFILSKYRYACENVVFSRPTQGRIVDGSICFGEGIDLVYVDAKFDIDTGFVVETMEDVRGYSGRKPSIFVVDDFYFDVDFYESGDDFSVIATDEIGLSSIQDSFEKSKYGKFLVEYTREGEKRFVYVHKKHLERIEKTMALRIRKSFEEITGADGVCITQIVGLE